MFYARTNKYGSPTSAGFDNTMEAVAFRSKRDRDAFVRDNGDTNMAVCSVGASYAKKIGITETR